MIKRLFIALVLVMLAVMFLDLAANYRENTSLSPLGYYYADKGPEELGAANLVADGFSMAASNYSGTKTEHEELAQLRAIEERHIDLVPEGEREEIRQIFRAKGFRGDQLEQADRLLEAHPQPGDRAVDDPVHGVVEDAAEEDGQRDHHQEARELLDHGGPQGREDAGLGQQEPAEPAAIGSTSRIDTYRHQPWNCPVARNPSPFAIARTGIVCSITATMPGGTSNSNRISQAR